MKPSVLIVDDSLTVRMNLDEAFRNAGFETTLCDSLAVARGAIATSAFALVVLDVMLPDGDGIDFLSELKASSASSAIPVILLSTEAEVRDRVRGLRTGADEYVGKPYDEFFLVSRARELVRTVQPLAHADAASTILIVDDSVTFREALRSILESHGYVVAIAGNGEEGLRLAATLRPRAMIVDGILPGIDGATVVRSIRQDAALRHTPCILLTASDEAGGELKALDAGADAYVRKEEDTVVVLARLAAILRSSGATSSIVAAASLLGPKRILAVDDSPTYLHELAGMLRRDGYEPILARSGEEALDLLAAQPVDCILLDLLMPTMSGHETCRRIKGTPAWRDIPIVMLTAREGREDMIEGINAGADDFLSKSSDFEVLRARLRAQLRRKQFEDENRSFREQLLQKEFETAQARAAQELADTRAQLLADLEEKNRELESFSYSVSHDLRAPLRHVSGFVEILRESLSESQLDPRTVSYLNRIRESTSRMGTLIDDLLTFSRIGRAEMRLRPLALKPLIDEVIEEASQDLAGRLIEWEVADLPAVQGDYNLLRQVFVNLIGNAVKFTRTRSPSVVAVGRQAGEAGGEVVVFVRDNGVGFDPRYADKLFGVFQRLHSVDEFEGSGIGLANVQRIVERHGGRVWAESQLDEGAVFFVALPCAERSASL